MEGSEAARGDTGMHLYNALLPPPVAERAAGEKAAFAGVVRSVQEAWRADDPDSVFATLKWIAVIELYIGANSEIDIQNVAELTNIGFEVFNASQNKLYAQVRWGNVLARLLKKYGKKLSLKVHWRPLYDSLMHTHFKRNTGPEGWRLRQRHFEAVMSLVQRSQKFFVLGSASEIWAEFRYLLENPWHNSCFEGAGFLKLFLPTNIENHEHYSMEWIQQCMDMWASIPNCQFWDNQWTAIIARCIRNCPLIDWDPFLSLLFTRYLNMFEVPVASRNATYPYSVDVPRNTRYLFSGKLATPAKAIAKSIVYLLKPGNSVQAHFERMVELLEPYYHPSNGGRWTFSLERFLRYLVVFFQKRLLREALSREDANKKFELHLGKSERVSFVQVVLKMIDRGQYSKSDSLADTVATATSILSYVEPSLVLPFVVARFHLALETTTATHQLKTAVSSVAFAGRSLCLASFGSSPVSEAFENADVYLNLIFSSLSNALLGMDANDPPKTLATMQLIGSIFSNLAAVDDGENSLTLQSSIDISEWLDEFLTRLFALLQHLEPNNAIAEGSRTAVSSSTFLVEDGPSYYCMLEIFLGKLSKPLHYQALKKISRFVTTNILPGAIMEIGLLCCACVHSNPDDALVHLIEPLLVVINSSLEGTPMTGFGGRGFSDVPFTNKATLSPALEAAVDYQLKILSVAITYAGSVLLRCKDKLKAVIASAFEAPSWKVNGAGDLVLRSVLSSLVLYYPLDQYKCSSHPVAPSLIEEWFSTKDNLASSRLIPRWHIPNNDEVSFADELLEEHFGSALDDLLRICDKIHSDTGYEKEHLKVTLLRIDSSLQGVLSCLPDFQPLSRDGTVLPIDHVSFFIAGSSGAPIGSSKLREKAAEVIHAACRYILDQRSDDSVLLLLVVRIMDALGNFGSLEYDEWANHKHAWKLESAAIIEPPTNFINSSHSKGKKRPRWAHVDKAYLHNTWRSSQASYHLFRINKNLLPSNSLLLLLEDLLSLSLHNYETVRSHAGRSLLKILKRCPFLVSKCVFTLTENLSDPKTAEHALLGSCTILATQTVLRHLTMDVRALSAFLLGILSSSHHESFKSQKSINELFIKYNIHFSGLSRSISKDVDCQSPRSEFAELISKISSMSFDGNLHWRYNLMANRILLLLTMASRNDSASSSEIIAETAGHFLKNLKSELPQSRMLAISALNILLHESSHRVSYEKDKDNELLGSRKTPLSSLEAALNDVFLEEGFFLNTLNSLSHVHLITDADAASSRDSNGMMSSADKSITRFYFEFSSSWPRTPSWISLLDGNSFYPSFARIYKRLLQECGMPVLLALRNTLEEFSSSKERPKQCVAAEALAGVLHSDIIGLVDAWNSWIMNHLEKIIVTPTVDSIPEWAACIRYAVTGKGKNGTRIPILRQKILDCLSQPLPDLVATSLVAKRYTFISASLIEISPPNMPHCELQFHENLLKELIDNMTHPSAQVRETIGIALSILCSNVRLYNLHHEAEDKMEIEGNGAWNLHMVERASEVAENILNANPPENSDSMNDSPDTMNVPVDQSQDVRWMETMFHFIISSLKSGRSTYVIDVIVGFLPPVFLLQETANKDMSVLAKAGFELLKWLVIPRSHVEKAVSLLMSLASNSNWRARFATLTYLRTFMYRHTYILSDLEKQKIWEKVEKLLTDNQVEVREHAAAVLAALLRDGDGEIADKFRDRSFEEACSMLKKRKQRNQKISQSIASVHGVVLALAACVLSVPYDMPSWLPDLVTALARFIGEPSPVRATVMKTIAEFRRTHADTWSFQKDLFTEEQLEVLADTSTSSSYFA